MRILLLGHGRMGKLVESLAPEYGAEVAGVLDETNNVNGEALVPGKWDGVEVAIDFSTADAVEPNVKRLAELGINAVIGTTGWDDVRPRVREIAAAANIGVVASPNFSPGVILFNEMVRRAAAALAVRDDYGAWIHEAHHAAKKDAPSGTALALERTMRGAGYARPIDMSSTRAGRIPGTHTVGFDGPSDTISLTHAARDRGAFARGALLAASWIRGRSGWFTMQDVLGLAEGGQS